MLSWASDGLLKARGCPLPLMPLRAVGVLGLLNLSISSQEDERKGKEREGE